MKNKNFGRKRQAIYILSNRKSTRIIKTLMDFFFFIKVKIKMVCFSVPSNGRVKGGHWVLHNQADFFPIDSLPLSFWQVEQIFRLEQDFAISTISVSQQPHNCLADGSFSRTGAANDGEHFPLA